METAWKQRNGKQKHCFSWTMYDARINGTKRCWCSSELLTFLAHAFRSLRRFPPAPKILKLWRSSPSQVTTALTATVLQTVKRQANVIKHSKANYLLFSRYNKFYCCEAHFRISSLSSLNWNFTARPEPRRDLLSRGQMLIEVPFLWGVIQLNACQWKGLPLFAENTSQIKCTAYHHWNKCSRNVCVAVTPPLFFASSTNRKLCPWDGSVGICLPDFTASHPTSQECGPASRGLCWKDDSRRKQICKRMQYGICYLRYNVYPKIVYCKYSCSLSNIFLNEVHDW